MRTRSLPFRSIVAGFAEAVVVVSQDPFSLTGEFDPKTGTIVNPHSSLYGESIGGKIFAYPYGRGSSCTSAILAEAIRLGVAPAAIINVVVEPILIVGALIAQSLFNRSVAIISVSEDVFRKLKNGDHLLIDTSTGRFLSGSP